MGATRRDARRPTGRRRLREIAAIAAALLVVPVAAVLGLKLPFDAAELSPRSSICPGRPSGMSPHKTAESGSRRGRTRPRSRRHRVRRSSPRPSRDGITHVMRDSRRPRSPRTRVRARALPARARLPRRRRTARAATGRRNRGMSPHRDPAPRRRPDRLPAPVLRHRPPTPGQATPATAQLPLPLRPAASPRPTPPTPRGGRGLEPGHSGECPACGRPVTARRLPVRRHELGDHRSRSDSGAPETLSTGSDDTPSDPAGGDDPTEPPSDTGDPSGDEAAGRR